MKVLHVNGATGYGGNEQQLMDITVKLSALGVDNAVFCAKNSVLSSFYRDKVEVTSFEARDRKFKSTVNRKFFKETILAFKPDIIHLHNSNSLSLFIYTYLLSKLNIPVVFSKKGMGSSMTMLSRLKYNFRLISKIICVSSTTLNAMKASVMFKKNIDKLIVVPDGVDTERPVEKQSNYFSGIQKDDAKVYIGHVANHNQAKDIPTLLKAIHYLVYDLGFKDFRLEQLGKEKTGFTVGIKTLVTELKIGDYVTFHGFIKDAIETFAYMDIVVVSSKREGGPSSLLEAMSIKKPVVSTNVGIVPEAIIDGVTGFIVPIGDFKMLAQKLHYLCLNSNKRKAFGLSGYDHFKEYFTAEKSALKTLDVYHSVLKKKQS
ncbi:MAG: glycosyltransferase family 4 protein [Nonlabens sp.]|uniref:glycosyltransferase family 4 protein n=1 Tax=Nonlabens sp. TaxID=1888209 RepID=UPI00321ACAA7